MNPFAHPVLRGRLTAVLTRQPRGTGPALCSLPASTAAVPALRRFTRGIARHWTLPEPVADAVALVVTELVGNAVLHSGSPNVTVLLHHTGAGLTVQVKDTGRWKAEPCETGTGPEAECGRGLELVRASSARVSVTTGQTGTCVRAHFELPAPRTPMGADVPAVEMEDMPGPRHAAADAEPALPGVRRVCQLV